MSSSYIWLRRISKKRLAIRESDPDLAEDEEEEEEQLPPGKKAKRQAATGTAFFHWKVLDSNTKPEEESYVDKEHAIHPNGEQHNAEKTGPSQKQNAIRNVPSDLVRFPICSLYISER